MSLVVRSVKFYSALLVCHLRNWHVMYIWVKFRFRVCKVWRMGTFIYRQAWLLLIFKTLVIFICCTLKSRFLVYSWSYFWSWQKWLHLTSGLSFGEFDWHFLAWAVRAPVTCFFFFQIVLQILFYPTTYGFKCCKIRPTSKWIFLFLVVVFSGNLD